jgi:protein-S-isoprenylcysteine O-methyltransferase Ste14
MCVIVLPSGMLLWFLIHPWARQWRKLGPARTYLIVLWILIGIAGVFYGITMWFEFQYWKYLNIATLIGVTELSRTGRETGKLLREGIYARLRHPRYASAALGLIGNALLIN